LYKHNSQLAPKDTVSRSLDQAVNELMARRIRGLAAFLARDKQARLLTRCLSLLFDRKLPESLSWSPVISSSGKQTVCYETVHEDLFTINVFDGTVLVNGLPPGALPLAVLSNELYERTFGDRNFLVVTGLQHFRAAKLVDERYLYEFQCGSDDSLLISETDEQTGAKRLLLDRNTIELPKLLRERHSHWYCTTNRCVVVRGIVYTDRVIRYIMNKDGAFAVSPEIQEVEPYSLILKVGAFDRLAIGTTTATDFLEGFESLDYVHILDKPEQERLVLSLPRFKLSFKLEKCVISCIDFSGFIVIDATSISDTLPHLKSAICIQHTDGRKLIIIRKGVVKKNAEISLAASLSEEMQSFVYEIHNRFGVFHARTTMGRLHLASIYASCPGIIPERRYEKPTHAIAAELVRQCWRNEPFTSEECAKLAEVSSHAELTCSSLSLVCCLVRCCSDSVKFLHEDGEAMPTNNLATHPLAYEDYVENPYAQRLSGPEDAFFGKHPRKSRIVISLTNHQSSVQNDVKVLEETINSEMVEEMSNNVRTSEAFPRARKRHCTRLDQMIFDDIELSHRLYCRLRRFRPCPSYRDKARALLEQIVSARRKTEVSIFETFGQYDQSMKAKLAICSGRADVVVNLDLLRLICDDGATIDRMRPDMVLQKRAEIVSECLDWATLCVLEDRLQRICDFDAKSEPQALLSELTCVRKWNPAEHPKWIAFEVEQCLQIRPDQYSIVKQLFKTSGGIFQLNMGLGTFVQITCSLPLCVKPLTCPYAPLQERHECSSR
jgi:hypothetical protein